MDRPSDFRLGHQGLIGGYRYGERKWEGYILDTQTVIADGAREQVTAIQNLQASADGHHEIQSALLQEFISTAGDAWGDISRQVQSLTDQLVTGFSSITYLLQYHSGLLANISQRLDQIAETIANPLATQANELFRNGEHLLRRGLYREAYDDLTAAAGKRSVNPVLHVHLAQLHYNVREEGVPFDFQEAEQHANLAIRYAKSLRDDLGGSGGDIIDLSFRTAADVALKWGGDLKFAGEREAAVVKLEQSDALLRQIDQPSPSSMFLHAQVLALLGRSDDAIAIIRALADFTRSWIPRALAEPNLLEVAEKVGSLGGSLRAAPGRYSQAIYQALSRGRSWVELCESHAEEFGTSARFMGGKFGEIEHDFEIGAVNAAGGLGAISEVCEKTLKETNEKLSRLGEEAAQIRRSAKDHHSKAESSPGLKKRDGEAIAWVVIGPIFFTLMTMWLAKRAVIPANAGFLKTFSGCNGCVAFLLLGVAVSFALYSLSVWARNLRISSRHRLLVEKESVLARADDARAAERDARIQTLTEIRRNLEKEGPHLPSGR